MTWEEWVESEYNTDEYYLGFSAYLNAEKLYVMIKIGQRRSYIPNINITNVIQSNNYILNLVPTGNGAN